MCLYLREIHPAEKATLSSKLLRVKLQWFQMIREAVPSTRRDWHTALLPPRRLNINHDLPHVRGQMQPSPAFPLHVRRMSEGRGKRQGSSIGQRCGPQVYERPDLVDPALAARILEAAEHPLAFDAFLSILFAPQAAAGSLDDMLRRYSLSGGQLLLVYGREDPWVRSIWGQRILR